jgi:S-formylglutathione hydrolase FrmB
MALCDLHWFSKTLDKHVGTYVYIPDYAAGPLATFYLLHGLSGDYTSWIRNSSIERYAAQHALIVVMPDGFRSFYTNNASGFEYAKYIGEELVARIESIFPAAAKRAARGVGGLSMGGYGALRIALAYPETFATAISHSGALMHGSRNHPRAGGALAEPEFRWIFGNTPMGSDHDLLALAKNLVKSKKKLPKIRIDCGADDDLIADNRAFHEKLAALRVAHEYEEFPGGHNWEYWDAHVQEALAFQSEHLRP